MRAGIPKCIVYINVSNPGLCLLVAEKLSFPRHLQEDEWKLLMSGMTFEGSALRSIKTGGWHITTLQSVDAEYERFRPRTLPKLLNPLRTNRLSSPDDAE